MTSPNLNAYERLNQNLWIILRLHMKEDQAKIAQEKITSLKVPKTINKVYSNSLSGITFF
jgi:hypothetical protein